MSLCGYLFLSVAQANELQIRADNTAPKNQQPIVLQTANGLPQVNIQTPNDKGLSHNKYQQFDVAQKGAILNNSRKNTQTEQGGWVQANPYLVGGEAKVILNEINAKKPSQLKGYIEVAGKKADVIIANPSGIHCEGCGIINAGRSTLTTGEVQLENGQVRGYRVEKGTVSVAGRGLDSSRQDYTDIIAKEVKINAGIWANELKVTTGQNQVSANNDSIQVIRAGDASQTQGYAVDVAELGGMYANNIHLIGTEHGLGVRNAGHIGAAAGEVKISSEGQLVNTGYIGAKQDIRLQSRQQTENQANGILYSQQGDLSVTSHQAGITQQGSFIAKGKAQGKGNIILKAKGTISQSGESLAEGDIRYRAKDIETTTDSVLAAGVQFTPTATTEEKTINPHSEQGQTLHLFADQHTIAHGQNLASDHLQIEAAEIDLSQSQTSANRLTLLARQGDIYLANSEILIDKTAALHTPTTLATPNAKLQAQHFIVQANALNNQQGYWQQTGSNLFDLQLPQGLNNQRGVLRTLGDFSYQGGDFDNQQGVVTTPHSLFINTQQQTFNNQSGLVSAQQDIQLITATLNNQQGVIQSQRNFNLTAPLLNNQQQGKLLAVEQIEITAQQLDNQTGLIQSNQANITTQQLDNRAGIIKATQADITAQQQLDNQATGQTGSLIQAATLRISTPILLNQQTKAKNETPTQGLIANTSEIKTDQWFNQSGGAYVSQALNATVTKLFNNQQGELLSLNTLTLQGNHLLLDNREGVIESRGNLTLDLKQWENIGQVKSAANANITIHNDFRLDTPLTVDDKLTLTVDNHFSNQTQLVTGKALAITAASIENPQSSELSAQTTQLTTDSLQNEGLIDGIKTVIVAHQLDNLGSGRVYGNHLAIQAQKLNNLSKQDNAPTLAARERLDLGVGTLTNYDHALILSQGDLFIGGELDNHHYATGQATFVDNGSATIEALGNGNINTQRLWNHDRHLRLGIHTDKERFKEYAQNNDSQRYRDGVEGELDWTRKSRKAWFAFYDGRRSPSQNDWFGWEYIRTTDTTTIEHRDPAKILIAGNLSLNGDQLHNQYSQILVGKTLTLGEQRFRKNTKNETLTANDVQLINEDLIGEIHRRDDGQSFMMVAYKDKNPIRPRYGHRSENYQDYHHTHPIEYFNFKIVDNTIGQAIQPTGTAIRQQTTAQQAALNNLQVDLSQSTPLSAVPHVRAVLPNQLLPQASLYRLNLATNSHVLVETDPRFTNKRQWLSSDYMFNALRADPQTMLKRLGDGYYEQRLVNEQINQLTGQRFLGNYTSDYQQYKALMDAGIRYAQRYQLIPGVALNAAQMQELTEDMVWLAPQTVTLKDGTQVQVLVPQVYLVKRDVDIQPTGAIISAKEIDIAMNGIVKNSGVIAGRHLTQISAQNLENYGNITADQLNFNITHRFYQQGGILAANNLNLAADSVLIESRFSENQDNGTFYRRQLDQQAQLNIQKDLTISTQGDAQFNAVKINTDNATFYIGGNLTLGTQAAINKEHYIMDADNYWKLDQYNEIATSLSATGNALLSAKKGINLYGTQVDTKNDLTMVSEQGNINIAAVRKQEQLSSGIKHTDKGLLSRTTIMTKHDHHYDLAQGSQLTANNTTLVANQGQIDVKGSTIVADNNVSLQAQDIEITVAKNTRQEHDFYSEKKSGVMSSGMSVTLGNRKEATDTINRQQITQGSQIGSLQGDIHLIAQENYQQQGSRVTAGNGDITIAAKKIDITAAENSVTTDYQHYFKQSGVTLGVNIPIIQAAQQVQQTSESIKRIGDAKDNHINALAAINAAFDLANTADVVSNVADAIANQGVQGLTQNIGISIGYGKQKSEQTIHTETTTASPSKINTTGNVMLYTTADKDTAHIAVKGSEIVGQQGTTLATAGDLTITAQQQTHQERSHNQSSGWNAGVAINYGSNGVAFSITAGGNTGKGYGNDDETTWTNSRIGNKQSQTTLVSGKDLTIQGGQVVGDSVKVQANNLNITSLQDTATYQGKQTSAQMTVGYGASLSGNYNQSKINADYASVNQQSGILAGDGGYNVNIDKKVDLKGGAILSTATSDKNSLLAQTFTFSDMKNYSKEKASAVDFNAGFSIGRDQTSEQDKKDNQMYRAEREKNGETFNQANPNKKNSSPIAFGIGEKDVHSTDLYAVSKIGLTNLLGNTKKSESDSSVTTSVISEGKFTISDQQGQENIKRVTKNVIEQTNSLKQKDYQALQKEVETDSAIKKGFLTHIAGFTDEAYRTMFIAEHRMFTAKTDENGNPIEDKKLTQSLDQEARQAADKKLQNGEITQAEYQQEVANYKKDQLGKGRNIYELREVSDREREHLKQVTYTDPITGETENRYVVAFNGIFNDKNAAAKFAWQNYVAKQGESGEIDTRIYKDVYFVHHPQANNAISELLIAGYEKMLEGELGTTLGISNSSAQAITLMKQYGTDNLFIGAHSRGTLTITNALNSLDNKENRENKLLSGTIIKMVGPAANVSRADNALSYLQTGEKRISAEGAIRIENHQSDVVGSLPIILGGNPATMNDNWNNKAFGKKLLDIFGDNSSVHNCYGLGQRQCGEDGYRKKDDLRMNKEKNIFELNNPKQEK
ncbi:two-partner secretion domain-containing protein [Gallibacterium anatis]|uniref:two-partner secretion domain-containing protein n=1 Tax=Gallibacterium anatis TaxID=750 RepID=UPI001F3E3DE0|nr:hemagglutinin repeat-containing protein [Gallibacterium anatis]